MQFLVIIAALALVIAVLSCLVSIGLAIRMQHVEERLAPRPRGLASGSKVPRAALAPLLGAGTIDGWLAGPSLLIFASPSCQPCRALVEVLNGGVPEEIGVRIAVVEPRSADGQSLRDLAHFSAHWIVDASGATQAAFEIQLSPHTFLIREGRVIDQVPGANIQPLLDTLQPAAATPASPPVPV